MCMLKKYGQIITFDLTKSFLSTGNVNRQVGSIEQKEVLKLSAISVDSELDFCNRFNCVNEEDD